MTATERAATIPITALDVRPNCSLGAHVSDMQRDVKETFHLATGFIKQAYHFFASCLPDSDLEFPQQVNGIHFCDPDHVRVYESELSYSFLLRYFGALEKLCNSLEIDEKKIPDIIKESSNDLFLKYDHARNLRHVISHGNGSGEIIRKPYVEFEKDKNGDLRIIFSDVDEFTETIDAVADVLIIHARTTI